MLLVHTKYSISAGITIAWFMTDLSCFSCKLEKFHLVGGMRPIVIGKNRILGKNLKTAPRLLIKMTFGLGYLFLVAMAFPVSPLTCCLG